MRLPGSCLGSGCLLTDRHNLSAVLLQKRPQIGTTTGAKDTNSDFFHSDYLLLASHFSRFLR